MESFVQSCEAFPRFGKRVWRFVETVLTLPQSEFNMTTYDDLHAPNDALSLWSAELYGMTVDPLRLIFDRERPPSMEELSSLPAIHNNGGCGEYGTYLGLVVSPEGRSNFVYAGAGTSLEQNLCGRAGDHLNLKYRQREQERAKHPKYLYHLLDDKKVPRTLTLHKAGLFELASGDPEDVLQMRVACYLHETMLDVFLQCWMSEKKNARAVFLASGPWFDKEMPWCGANGSLPLGERLRRPEERVDIDPERRKVVAAQRLDKLYGAVYRELADRKLAQVKRVLSESQKEAARKRARRHAQSADFDQAKVDAYNAWHRIRVKAPAQAMMRENPSSPTLADRVEAFKKEALRNLQADKPWLPRDSDGKYRRPPLQRKPGGGRKRKDASAASTENLPLKRGKIHDFFVTDG